MKAELTPEEIALKNVYMNMKNGVQRLISNGVDMDKIVELVDKVKANTETEAEKFKNATHHARWNISSDGYYPYCSECYYQPQWHVLWAMPVGALPDRCAGCYAYMDNTELEDDE